MSSEEQLRLELEEARAQLRVMQSLLEQLKQTEAELQQSQAHLQSVLLATGTGIYWWDVERHVGGRDEQTARILGYDSTGEKDRGTLAQFLHPDDAAEVVEKIREVVSSGGHYKQEHRIIRADGTVRWIVTSGRMIQGPHGPRLLGGVRDVTERKLREQQMAKARKLESIGRLAGGIAHDFNNMLTVISSNTERVLRKLPEQSPLRADLTAVRQAADRSAALTAQLLAVSRRQLVMPDLVRIDDVVRGSEDLLRRAIGKDNQLVLSLAATEPVRIDPRQLEQVLTNLASNARDAMPEPGRVTVSTTLATVDDVLVETIPGARAGRYVKLAFSDTGVGIAADDLEHIFEPFFTTKEQGKGTELGLATCYGIVAQAEGFMTVSSAPHAGATFEVFLPVAAR